MATYRQVKISFWTDPFVCDNFSAEDKYFYLYLLTNIHTNLCGCYDVSKKQIATEMGYSVDSVASIIDRFAKTYRLIAYDRDTNELLILNWSKHNWTDSPKFRKLLKKEIDNIKNVGYRNYLTDVFDGKDVSKYVIQTPDTVSGTPDTSLLVTVIDIDSNTSNTSNLENDTNTTEVNKRKKVRKRYEDTEDFKRFWDAYPKQKGKTEAREAFAKVDVPIGVLLSALDTQKQSRDWIKDGGQYIPYPAKWLNKRRWEDSVDVNIGIPGMERYSNLQRLAEEFDDE